jgi:D-cysteine desulfhydrase
VRPLTGLMSALGHGPGLLAKREGLCGIAAGRNKIRQLAALLGDALAQRAPVVLTTGAVQSNHCALTAITVAMHVFQV